MAATETGVWNLQDVRDKQLAGEWSYTGENQLWISGSGSGGRMGSNSLAARSSPIQIPGNNWGTNVDLDGGGSLNCFGIKTDGTLWAWGENQNGKLGLNQEGPSAKYSSPVQLPGTTWAQVTSGTDTASAIKTDGALWIWGRNNYGRLGLNSLTYYSSPIQIGSDTTWSKATHTDQYMFALKTDNTLWGWGRNGEGQLGQNARNPNGISSPVQIPGSWIDIEGGNSRAGAVNSDGELFTWGYNANGDLGHNNRTHYSSPVQIPGSWSRISVRGEKMLGVKTDGTLWGWGNNYEGSLGQNYGSSPANNFSSPAQVGTDTTWATVSNSYGSACATKTDGTLWAWGSNGSGQLGHNNLTSYSSPVQVPGNFLLGEIYGGSNLYSIKQF